MLVNGKDNVFEYHGWEKSNIVYDSNARMWVARNIKQKEFQATSKATKSSLLLGPQHWTIVNDSELIVLIKLFLSTFQLRLSIFLKSMKFRNLLL